MASIKVSPSSSSSDDKAEESTLRQLDREFEFLGFRSRNLNPIQFFPADKPFDWTAAFSATDARGQISRNWQRLGKLHHASTLLASMASFRFGNAAEPFNMRTDSAGMIRAQNVGEFESLLDQIQRGPEGGGDQSESSMQVGSSATAIQAPQRDDRPDDSPVLGATETTTPKATVNQCCVCLEPIGELWAFRPCGHANVCHPCIEKWERAARSFTCPTCRRDVTETMRIYVT
jgi:hypothetical protein